MASVTGSQSGVVINPSTPVRLSVSAQAGATARIPFSITVTAWDAYNNVASNYTGTISFTSTDRAAVLPRHYTFTAADQGVHTFTNGVTLKTAGTQTITATGTAIPAGIAAWWPGDRSARDIIGGNNGTLVGGVTFGPGVSGPAFSFNGSNYVSVPTSPSLNPTSQVSLEAWVNPGSTNTSEAGIAGTWDDVSGNNRTYFLWLLNGVPNFYVSHTGTDYPSAVAATPLQPGHWYHLVGTFDGTNIRIYVNGSLAGTTFSPGSIHTNSQPFYIGRTDTGGATNFFNGQIDEVAVFNRALSPAEIQWIYQAGSASMHKTIAGSASVTVGS
jgi:hypothetical protein